MLATGNTRRQALANSRPSVGARSVLLVYQDKLARATTGRRETAAQVSTVATVAD